MEKPCQLHRDFNQFDSLTMLYGDLAPSIRRAVRDVVDEYKNENHFVKNNNAHIVVELPNQPPKVFGLSEKDVLEMDGDPNGAACSDAHIRNDMSNRWCHAMIVKVIQETLKKNGDKKVTFTAFGDGMFFINFEKKF